MTKSHNLQQSQKDNLLLLNEPYHKISGIWAKKIKSRDNYTKTS